MCEDYALPDAEILGREFFIQGSFLVLYKAKEGFLFELLWDSVSLSTHQHKQRYENLKAEEYVRYKIDVKSIDDWRIKRSFSMVEL